MMSIAIISAIHLKSSQMPVGVFCLSALLECWAIQTSSFVLQLSRAEQRMNRLDQCYCERTCTMKGTTYREFESWTDGCKNCTCLVWLLLEFRLIELRRPSSLKMYLTNVIMKISRPISSKHNTKVPANPVKSKEPCIALLKTLSSL